MNIEIEIQELDSMTSWNEKIEKTKRIREKIEKQKKKFEELANQIVKNEIPNVKKPKKGITLDDMLREFKSAKNLDDKMKYYGWIVDYISKVEKELFTE
jgi:adenylate kinase family enzyme